MTGVQTCALPIFIAPIRHIDFALTVYAQTLGPPELPVSASSNPPLAQEPALWIEDLDPMIVSV